MLQQKQAQNTLNQVSHSSPDMGDPPTALTDRWHQFKENPDAWLLVDKILQQASYPQTKCTHRPQPTPVAKCAAYTDRHWPTST